MESFCESTSRYDRLTDEKQASIIDGVVGSEITKKGDVG